MGADSAVWESAKDVEVLVWTLLTLQQWQLRQCSSLALGLPRIQKQELVALHLGHEA